MNKSAIVIGSGIIGIAAAYTLLQKGYRVTVLEKNHQPIGASIRNFGMIWPIGQPAGEKYDTAILSKQIWESLSKSAGFHLNGNGSLHLAYHPDEKDVLQEFIDLHQSSRSIQWLSPQASMSKSKAINPASLLGAMYSHEEALVDPREAILKLILYLQSLPNCTIHFNTPIYSIVENSCVGISATWQADKIFVCSGSDIRMLFPDVLDQYGMLCELQMMRTYSQPFDFNLGPSLCAGLTLAHYGAFKEMKSLSSLMRRFEIVHHNLLHLGIHVMAAQYEHGEVTIGDSHEYGSHFSPFIDQRINEAILIYLKTFCILPELKMLSYWKGIYFKLKNNQPYIFQSIDDYTTIVNGFGGSGMTLSFGALQKELATL